MRKMKKTILISAILFHVIAVPGWAGTIVVWGNNSYGQVDDTPSGDDWVDVSAGGCHIMALREDGSVVAWGDNWFGQCDIPEGTKAITISAGETFSLWLKADGSVGGCGDDTLGQISDLPTGTDITAIAAGGYHSLVLRNDGSLYSCGMDSCGQVGNTPSGNNFVGIACGLEFSVALRDDGTVVGWGDNSSGQLDGLETLTDIKKVSCGWGHTLCMGSVWLIGANDHGQCDVPPAIPLIDGDCGGVITLTLLENGQMMTFGLDADGLVGDTPIDGDFKKISAGSYNNAAIKESGVENQPPTADPGGPYSGMVGFPITFDGSGSTDSDGSIVLYEWDFGDESTDIGVSPSHTYAEEGLYAVILKVTDNDLASNSAMIDEVDIIPVPTIPIEPAFDPFPADGADNVVPIEVTLGWRLDPLAISCNVYFGIEGVFDFMGNQAETTFALPVLEVDTTHNWRIDSVDAGGNTQPGIVWIFTTITSTDDSDGDGVPDDQDAFPDDPDEWADADRDGIGDNADRKDDSDMRDTVVVGGFETDVPNPVYDLDLFMGLSLQDLISTQEDNPFIHLNHGQYVKSITILVKEFLNVGLITEEGADIIVSCAARSDIGK